MTMTKSLAGAAVILGLAASGAPAQDERPQTGADHHRKGTMTSTADKHSAPADSQEAAGQILVRFADDLAEARIETINSRLGASVLDRMMEGRLLLVEIPYPDITDEVIAAYAATEGVLYAEPNEDVSIPQPPDDPQTDDDAAPVMPLPRVE